MRIYITHCSAKKDSSFKKNGLRATPDILYTATPTKRFMDRCKAQGVCWAIFSDKYGVWFPDVLHEWYEKDPNAVTPDEYRRLLDDFNVKLSSYSEILFYANPGRFHPLYKQLIADTILRDRVRLITHIAEIV